MERAFDNYRLTLLWANKIVASISAVLNVLDLALHQRSEAVANFRAKEPFSKPGHRTLFSIYLFRISFRIERVLVLIW